MSEKTISRYCPLKGISDTVENGIGSALAQIAKMSEPLLY
jgi:hypothetical protein